MRVGESDTNSHYVPCVDGSDYSAPVGGQILQFGPGNTSFTVPLTIVSDGIFELTENLQAILSFPDGGDLPLVLLDPGVANITIFDDDGKHCISPQSCIVDRPLIVSVL